jgi:transposase-like protein
LLAGADAKAAFEKNGLLDELKNTLAERVLNAESDHHLETGEADGRVNSRNGYGKCPPARSGRASRQRDAQRQEGSDRDREDCP